MAVVNIQILCDHFDDEDMLHELIGDVKGALRRGGFAFELKHQEFSTYTKLTDNTDLRQIMAVVNVEIVTTQVCKLLATAIDPVLKDWEFGEFGGWVITARLGYNGIHEQPLSEIEQMNFLLDKPTDDTVPF